MRKNRQNTKNYVIAYIYMLSLNKKNNDEMFFKYWLSYKYLLAIYTYPVAIKSLYKIIGCGSASYWL